jgi:quinol monooxygenase YgiN
MSIHPTNQIVLVIEYDVALENRSAFVNGMAKNCRDTLNDDGCLRMEFCEPIDGDGEKFVLTELWRDQESIDKHRQKPGHSETHAATDALVEKKRVLKLHPYSADG